MEKPSEKERPRDTGYVLGAMIVEYFYKNALNLNDATRVLLALTDYNEFMKTNNYQGKFK